MLLIRLGNYRKSKLQKNFVRLPADRMQEQLVCRVHTEPIREEKSRRSSMNRELLGTAKDIETRIRSQRRYAQEVSSG
jgi:hypothetical protein